MLASHAQLAAAGAAFPYGAFGLLLQYVGPTLEEALALGPEAPSAGSHDAAAARGGCGDSTAGAAAAACPGVPSP